MVAGLVNVTRPEQSATLEMGWPGRPDLGLRQTVALRTMRDQDAGRTLAGIQDGSIARCILPWVRLMHGAADLSMLEVWKELASAESSAPLRPTYAGLALVFADLVGTADEWRRALEGWDMRESQVVAEWKAEGRAEGETARARTDLLRLLNVRFPGEVAPDVQAAGEATSDMAQLSRWFDAAALAPTWSAFRASFGPSNGTPS